MQQGIAKGVAQGRSEGIAQGSQERAREAARKMLQKGFSLADITEITQLPLEAIQELQQ